MEKKAVIFGTGSIAKKHYRELKKRKFLVFFYSIRKIKKKNLLNSLDSILHINPKVFIIATKTSDHYKNLLFINNNFNKKIILVEKPLFSKWESKIVPNNNNIYIGYNLRFNPVIQFLKKKVQKKKTYMVQANCQTYLPNWRSNIDYRKSYSSNRILGGGVLLDLSHEIDFIQYIFGNITKIDFSINKKISNLKINSNDYFCMHAKIKKINFNLHLNYFSKFQSREIFVHTTNNLYKCNLIKNKIKIFMKNKKTKIINFKKVNTYKKMYNEIFSKNNKNIISDYHDGIKLMKLLEKL
jgi:hypothetical protein